MEYRKQFILFATMLASFSVNAGDNIYSRANDVVAKLEVLNNLGRKCDYRLSINGSEGMISKNCKKYMKNIRGPYFDSVGTECNDLNKWYNKKIKFIGKNKNIAEKSPEKAKELISSMKAINKACGIDSLRSYEYIIKPLNKMKALGDLE